MDHETYRQKLEDSYFKKTVKGVGLALGGLALLATLSGCGTCEKIEVKKTLESQEFKEDYRLIEEGGFRPF